MYLKICKENRVPKKESEKYAKKLPIFILALIILLQACFPAVYASSKNEATGLYASFCPFDTRSKGAGECWSKSTAKGL